MAAPITHVVLTEKIFKNFFPLKNKREFIIGTSFPDIRYLGVIDRSKTHFLNLTIQNVQNTDSFLAGVKFHALVDLIRERYMIEVGIYNLFPESKLRTQAVKVFEDRMMYQRFEKWTSVANYFDDVIEGELKFGIEVSQIERWHNLLQSYFLRKPEDDLSIRKYIEDIGMPQSVSEEIVRVLNNVSNKDKAIEIVNNFYLNFEDLIL